MSVLRNMTHLGAVIATSLLATAIVHARPLQSSAAGGAPAGGVLSPPAPAAILSQYVAANADGDGSVLHSLCESAEAALVKHGSRDGEYVAALVCLAAQSVEPAGPASAVVRRGTALLSAGLTLDAGADMSLQSPVTAARSREMLEGLLQAAHRVLPLSTGSSVVLLGFAHEVVARIDAIPAAPSVAGPLGLVDDHLRPFLLPTSVSAESVAANLAFIDAVLRATAAVATSSKKGYVQAIESCKTATSLCRRKGLSMCAMGAVLCARVCHYSVLQDPAEQWETAVLGAEWALDAAEASSCPPRDEAQARVLLEILVTRGVELLKNHPDLVDQAQVRVGRTLGILDRISTDFGRLIPDLGAIAEISFSAEGRSSASGQRLCRRAYEVAKERLRTSGAWDVSGDAAWIEACAYKLSSAGEYKLAQAFTRLAKSPLPYSIPSIVVPPAPPRAVPPPQATQFDLRVLESARRSVAAFDDILARYGKLLAPSDVATALAEVRRIGTDTFDLLGWTSQHRPGTGKGCSLPLIEGGCADAPVAEFLSAGASPLRRLCHEGAAETWEEWAAKLSPGGAGANVRPLDMCSIRSQSVYIVFKNADGHPTWRPSLPDDFFVRYRGVLASDNMTSQFMDLTNATIDSWRDGRVLVDWPSEVTPGTDKPQFIMHLAPGKYDLARGQASGVPTCSLALDQQSGQRSSVITVQLGGGTVRCQQTAL